METGMLKEEVMKIEMPEVMKERIAAQCTSRMQECGKAGFRLYPASVSALFLICFALAGVSGLAYGKLQGYFRDVKNPIGAVTGTAYEDADEEDLKWITCYQMLQYNEMFDKKGRSSWFFPYLKQTS